MFPNPFIWPISGRGEVAFRAVFFCRFSLNPCFQPKKNGRKNWDLPVTVDL